MALTGEQIEQVTRGTVDLYRSAEQAILETVTRYLAAGMDAPDWATSRLAALGALRATVERTLGLVQADGSERIRDMLAQAYRSGQGIATKDLPAQLLPDVPDLTGAAQTVPRIAVVESLAAALISDIEAKHSSVLRRVLDVFRTVIAQATAVSVAGGQTRRQAAQWAYARLVDQGVTSFVDVSGRRWRLSSYVEMATRTVTQRSAVQGQTDRLTTLGVDTVIVSDSPRECPKCRPWEGKVLSISGSVRGRVELPSMVGSGTVTVDIAGSVAEARAAGLQHPNCTHSLRAYLPGATRRPTKPTANPKGYEAKERQRELERGIRRWKERESAALTPEAKATAAGKVRAWQKAMRNHLAANPELKRLSYREQPGAGNIPPAGTPTPAAPPPATPIAPPAPPAPPPYTAADVVSGDFSRLTRVGPQAGSNPGGLFEAADGSKWYVKAQKSQAHADNEATAARLYREAGIDVPEVVQGRGLAELGDVPMTATRYLDDAARDLADRLTDPDYVVQAREGFALDAWLGNWDAVGLGFDNIVTSAGRPWRIDVGGALRYRAQGQPKGAAWGKSVTEWATLRDPARAPQAARVFGGMTREELLKSVERVKAIKPARIRELVADADLAETLIARRKDLLARARKLAEPTFDERIQKAKAGRAGLDQPPLRLTVDTNEILGQPSDWPPSRVRQVTEALRAYRGSGYREINDALRSARVDRAEGRIRDYIRRIDQAMDASRLPADVVVWRGVTNPTKVFGPDWNDTSVVGLTWNEASYASSSADERVARTFSGVGSGSVVIRLLVPRGTPAVRLSDHGPDHRNPGGISEEAEALLHRGLTFRVVADHGYDGGVRRIDVEVIGHDRATVP